MRNEKGVVLVTGLMVMTLLLTLAMSLLQIAMYEGKMSVNYRNHTQAFYTAEAGLALVQRHLRMTPDWTTLDGTTGTCVSLLPGATLQGSCTYSIASSAQGAVVEARGQFITEVATVRAGFTNAVPPLPPGAITSVGLPGTVAFAGNAFSVDGNNWIPPTDTVAESQDNTVCPGAPYYGVAVNDNAAQAKIKAGLTAQQEDNITGAAPNPPWAPVSMTPSVGVDPTLTSAAMIELRDKLIGFGGTIAPGTQYASETLGTVDAPRIIAVDASGYAGSPALTLSASKGAGVLVVKDGTLKLSGATTWVGLVLLVGKNARIEMDGGGDKAVYGSVVIVEETVADAVIATGGGNLKVRYSCGGLDVARTALNGASSTPRWWTEL
jgi:hypothetical protein